MKTNKKITDFEDKFLLNISTKMSHTKINQ